MTPRSLILTLPFLFTILSASAADPIDWPTWRGANHDGIANPEQSPPIEFSKEKSVIWSTPIPGRGHGSATVVGDQVFFTTAEKAREVQSVISLDRATGKERWVTEIHSGGWPKKMNKKGSQASSTIACDGERLFISFWNAGAIHATALDLAGKILWQKKLTDYVIHQAYATSPAVYQDLVLFAADNKKKGALLALKRETGEEVWKVERPKKPNYSSPIIHHLFGKDQVVFSGCDLVTSLNPATGKKLWEVEGATTECVTSVVTDGERVFTSGGYPKNHVSAVMADGSGTKVWEVKNRVYVPSMLCRDGVLFGVMDAGIAVCWKSDTGEELWKGRLGGTFSSSPVLVGDQIFVANESGDFFVYKASTTEFELVAKNRLGDENYATPTICGGRIYHRVAFYEGKERKEVLFCLGLTEN